MSDSSTSPEPQGECLLVVDDDGKFVSVLAAAMRRRGYHAVVAGNAEEALEEAEAWGPPKRAIVDLRMPGRGGLELVKDLVARYAGIEVVVLTGYGSIATAVEAIKLGAVNYLTKPADADAISRAFEQQAPLSTASEEERPMPLEQVEWEHLQSVLTEVGGNISEAARRLGMHRRTLQRKLSRGRPD